MACLPGKQPAGPGGIYRNNVTLTHGITINRYHLSEVLSRNAMSYKRTSRTVRHKQTPEQVADKKASLETLKKGQRPD